jgi:hypothetical protein
MFLLFSFTSFLARPVTSTSAQMRPAHPSDLENVKSWQTHKMKKTKDVEGSLGRKTLPDKHMPTIPPSSYRAMCNSRRLFTGNLEARLADVVDCLLDRLHLGRKAQCRGRFG